MKKQNILFVCKHNVFRSKIAEAYFNKNNKNNNFRIKSAGIIRADVISDVEKKIIKFQRETAREFGINVEESSTPLSINLLKEQDMIIIVADDVPPKIFKNPFYLKPDLKVVTWKIPDVKGDKNDVALIKEDIKKIMKKVKQLIKKLEKSK
ncbi:MAG: hypothetical protein ABIJ14_03465 [Nanoarchaeota archaeon]